MISNPDTSHDGKHRTYFHVSDGLCSEGLSTMEINCNTVLFSKTLRISNHLTHTFSGDFTHEKAFIQDLSLRIFSGFGIALLSSEIRCMCLRTALPFIKIQVDSLAEPVVRK